MSSEQVLAFTRASVAGRPEVEFCVDLAARDVVAVWLLDNHQIDEPIMRAFLGLVAPGARVLDLGCHIGTFSLPASGLGAHVISVDASPQHVELIRHAARRNGFTELEVVHGAIAASREPIEFIELSIHGHVQQSGESSANTVTVPSVGVDELIRARGWDGVDLIKMDVEGNELNALGGMAELFASGARPAIVFECNGGMLPRYGASICALRQTLAELDYQLFLIDHLRPGVLVRSLADGVQPESASDYLAIPSLPADFAEQWRIEPPFTLEQTLARLAHAAAGEADGYRAYSAELLAHGPQWLRSHPIAQSARAALERDVSAAVRASCAGSPDGTPALGHADTPRPASSIPRDAVVWASGLHVEEPDADPAPPPGLARVELPGRVLLEDLYLHVRAGELVAVYAPPEQGGLLLHTLARLCPARVGELHVGGPAILLSALGDGLEAELTVAENFKLIGAFLGCHVPEIARRLDELAELAGASELLGTALGDAPSALATRIALTVALECAQPRLLLLDRLPPVEDERFSRWIAELAASRCAGGLAIVQLVEQPREALRAPDRAVWIDERRVRLAGHPRSVFEALWHSRFEPAAQRRFRAGGRVAGASERLSARASAVWS
ncbi:MAG TPA: FkbM family methyltransferase [Solirubrobacteraceae bacterium]|jgi:FkbM family methyltransferase|nr:FkbM family methyltransferase [Solirubrobacteraceae bacterium]